MICLFLTVRLAYVSLFKSIEAEKQMRKTKKTVTINKTNAVHKTIAIFNAFQTSSTNNDEVRPRALTLNSCEREVKLKIFFSLIVKMIFNVFLLERKTFTIEHAVESFVVAM